MHSSNLTKDPDFGPALQRLLAEARERPALELRGRERVVDLAVATAFLCAAVPAAVLLPSHRPLSLGVAVTLTLIYAIASRVTFYTGAGWTVPTQVVLVPMLFALPVAAVPLFVAAGLLLGNLPDWWRGRAKLDRAAIGAACDAWHAVGPAVILSVAGAAAVTATDWPLYLGALAAQFGVDFAAATTRARLGLGVRPRLLLDELMVVYRVDALLAPIGLLAAFATADQEYAFVLTLPLIGLIAIFARERQARVDNALALGHAYRGTALLLAEVLSDSDAYTGQHSRGVVVLAHRVASRMGLDERQVRDVEFAALLHDVGKITVPPEVINKPGDLSLDELAMVRTHVVAGEEMLERIGGVLAEVGHVVRSHHEHFDGKGYPDGLAGDEIPLPARVVACCDAFNAMITDRPYRSAMSVADALAELHAHAGSQFDPRVVDALTAVVRSSEPEAFGDAPEPGLRAIPA